MASGISEREIGNHIEAQETERARIARELHDSLGQKVALLQLILGLDEIARTLPSREHRAQLRQLSVHVAEIAQELRDVSHELHPLKLELLGWAKSIEALCRESSRQSEVEITFSCDAGVPHADFAAFDVIAPAGIVTTYDRQAVQERLDRQPLQQNREQHHTEGDRDEQVALRQTQAALDEIAQLERLHGAPQAVLRELSDEYQSRSREAIRASEQSRRSRSRGTVTTC
jgi:ADP-ribose pyrophosphatase YjhB (NUDIX family)